MDNGTADLTDLTISDGKTSNSGGGLYNDATLALDNCTFTNDSAGEEGGGLDNEANLTVTHCNFTNNSANYGGGFYNDATLDISDSTISDNSITGTGGGAGFGNEGEATVSDCNVTNNTANGNGDVGGGILNYYLLAITGGSISGNSSFTSGGGIDDKGTASSVTNCTISQNSSANGGGVYSDATTTLSSSVITDNTATGTGGGVSDSAGSTVKVDGTTISGNSAAGNGGGVFNLGALTITDSTLSDNVSAVDGGGLAHLSGATLKLASDQRGDARSVTTPDIGAFEGAPVAALTVVSTMPATSTVSARTRLSILGLDPNTGNGSDLTYTWSVSHAPSGAKSVTFSQNGNNAAKGTTARFQKAGTYHLLCTISNGVGGSVTQMVSMTIKQVATSLRLTPHHRVISAGDTLQYGAEALDQFGHMMRTTPVTTYAVKSGDGTIDHAGLFSAGQIQDHVVIQITEDGLTGIVGATII